MITRKIAAQYTMKAQNVLEPELEASPADQSFIPNLCQVNATLFLLILTQLMVLMFALMRDGKALIDWEYLGLASVFSQTIVLSCAAAICLTRKLLRKQKLTVVVGYFLGIIIGLTWFYSWLCSTVFLSESLPGMISEPTHFVLRNILISAIIGCLLLRYFYLQFQWREQKQAELRARLEALQARIRPHFLFNSMNTIASLISIDPQQAEEAVLDLSTLFRATLDNHQSLLITLADEIALCRRYLNIERLRLGSRLRVEWSLDGCESTVKIPPLTLQPLIENAIYHGIQPLTAGGTITIQCYCKNRTIYVLIANPFDPNLQQHQGNHIALDNIRSRLSALFSDAAVLKTSQLDGTFTVTLRFPMTQ